MGLSRRKDDRRSSKWLGVAFPEHGQLIEKVTFKMQESLSKLEPRVEKLKKADIFEMQASLVVALQVLIAPIRGKPFWSLKMVDNGECSMFLAAYTVHNVNPADFHVIQGKDVFLHIRQQKTAKSFGTTRVPLPPYLSTAYKAWVEQFRPQLANLYGANHEYVFMKQRAMLPFDSRAFSGYVKHQFSNIVGQPITLQMMRRLFASCMFPNVTLSSFAMS